MNASTISVGDTLKLKQDNAYGLDGEYEVTEIKQRNGYKTPWIVCRSHRPEAGVLFFRPSDFAKHA